MADPDAQPLESYPRKPPVTFLDWFMLLLAIASVALLSWVTFGDVSAETERRVVLADYVVCGVFAVEFAYRWRRSGLGLSFLGRYWYEVLGMIPISHPAFRSFRLLRIVVVVARLGRAADRAFGDRLFGALVERFAETIVQAIRRPVTIAVLDEVIAVVQTGQYAEHVASAIEENRGELDALVVELIREDRLTSKLRFVPFSDEVVRQSSDTVFRIVHRALEDPRVHELISDVIKESATQLRASVRQRLHEDVKADVEKVGRR